MLRVPAQNITIIDLTDRPLRDHFETATFAENDAYLRPVDNIDKHVRQLGCQSIVIERHYIDRDYMEEHGVFYSRSLAEPPNYCERLHFFRTPAIETQQRLRAIAAQTGKPRHARLRTVFGREAYLGFVVKKPLPGAPVGRTVLPPPHNDDREFSFVRLPATVHIVGVPLPVSGLPFQQQDMGVSACASTAVWTSLQNMRGFETLRSVTPTHVTQFGAASGLPSGRAMPSEGLTLGQMCEAIHAVELAPNVLTAANATSIAKQLFTIGRSGFAPVLLLDCLEHRRTHHHAVTMAGYRLRPVSTADARGDMSVTVSEIALSLTDVYVHDDRIGPYVKATISTEQDYLVLEEHPLAGAGCELRWRLRNVIVPLHQKIRLSFGALDTIVARIIDLTRDAALKAHVPEVFMESWITPGIAYAEQLLETENAAAVEELLLHVVLPRYVGVIQVGVPECGSFDVLADTTSTIRNPVFVRVVVMPSATSPAEEIARSLASALNCDVLRL
jgi:hypothetical protein